MTTFTGGVPSRPVIFTDGQPPLPRPDLSIYVPENVWNSIENTQVWTASNGLDLDSSHPYIEPPGTSTAEKIAKADERRASGERYTDRRSLSDFSLLFNAPTDMLVAEFAGRSVLDIGSGAGVLSNDLRMQAGAASVTEIDFSLQALQASTSPNRRRVVSDGMRLGLADASADRTISMFSTTLHGETVSEHLQAICEAIRVTKQGGRVFLAPFIAGMNRRANHLHMMQTHSDRFLEPIDLAYKQWLRQEAAKDFAATGLMHGLIKDGVVSLTPTLRVEEKSGEKRDAISAMLDIHQPLTADEATTRIKPYVALFSPKA